MSDASDGQVVFDILGRPTPPPPLTGAVESRPTVEVRGPSEALTVGPDEVLVVVVRGIADRYSLEQVRSRLLDSRLRPDQILLFGSMGPDDVTIAKAPRSDIRVVLEGE